MMPKTRRLVEGIVYRALDPVRSVVSLHDQRLATLERRMKRLECKHCFCRPDFMCDVNVCCRCGSYEPEEE